MNVTTEMLKATPNKPFAGQDLLAECLRACADCAQACVSCADACLGEEQVAMLKRCIRLNYDCADLCQTTERMLLRQIEPDMRLMRGQLEMMALACRACGDECAMHKDRHEHCRVCMDACRTCEKACNDLMASMQGAPLAH